MGVAGAVRVLQLCLCLQQRALETTLRVPHAGTDGHRDVRGAEALTQQALHVGDVGVRDTHEHHAQSIPGEAGAVVVVAQHFTHDGAGSADLFVAGRVAVHLVAALELIEFDHEDGGVLAELGAEVLVVAHAVFPALTSGHPGERIGRAFVHLGRATVGVALLHGEGALRMRERTEDDAECGSLRAQDVEP